MSWEIEFLEWIDRVFHSSDLWNQIVKYFSITNEIGLLWIVFGIVLLCQKKYRKIGLVMLISLLAGFIINDLVLKKIIMRPRPYEKSETLTNFVNSMFVYNDSWGKLGNKLLGGTLPSGSSFPSGHTCTSFNCAFFLCLTKNKRLYIPALVIAIMMALSRLFLCVHYPTDVLGGIAVGCLIGLASFFIFKKPFALESKSKCA